MFKETYLNQRKGEGNASLLLACRSKLIRRLRGAFKEPSLKQSSCPIGHASLPPRFESVALHKMHLARE